MTVPATLENENALFDGLVDSVTCRYFRKNRLANEAVPKRDGSPWSTELLGSREGEENITIGGDLAVY